MSNLDFHLIPLMVLLAVPGIILAPSIPLFWIYIVIFLAPQGIIVTHLHDASKKRNGFKWGYLISNELLVLVTLVIVTWFVE